ncbi:MAG: hypothetical protein FWG02_10555 [Holophagaceae bacterium]|jgi:hypothetical protein|nr:hypothetical protein [Holophagaceae bacterium]
MQETPNERARIRVQYQNGKWADLSESQLAAICKVSGIERLLPHLQILGKSQDVVIDVRLQKGGQT